MTFPFATMITVLILIAAALVIAPMMKGGDRRRRDADRLKPNADESRRLLDLMKAMAAPTLLMRAADTPSFSKLGGEPDVPPGAAWPVGPRGAMGFLLQVDLSAARGAGGPDWLPAEGALWVFVDDRWGDPDQVRVLYGAPGDRTPTPVPISVARARRYGERFVEFSARTSLPSLDWLGVDLRRIKVTGEQLDALADMPGDLGDAPHHLVGGYPEEIQEINLPLAAECVAQGLGPEAWIEPPPGLGDAAKTWRLLFQVDYDADLKMKWGDGGHIYVLVREADARAGDFSRTATFSDSY